jgi:hypothetical protein
VSKQFGRIALAIMVTLALSLGVTAFAGSANASSTSSSCASQHAQVVKAQKHVKKDKKKLKKAKRHHNHKAIKKAKRHLKRDRKALHRAQAAYRACLNRKSPTPSPSPSPTPTPNPVTEQCLAAAGQITSQDPSGQLATGAGAFCDLLGQLAASAPTGTDPTALCSQLASQDPTGQFGQVCDGLGSVPIPSGGLPTGGLPTGGLPTGTGGVIGRTLEGICDQIASQEPCGKLEQLCVGLGGLPV